MTRSVVQAIGWSTTITCNSRGNPGKGCDARLKVTPDDVHWGSLDGRDDPDAGACFVQCPHCGTWTDLHAFMVPEAIAAQARRRGLPDSPHNRFVEQKKAA